MCICIQWGALRDLNKLLYDIHLQQQKLLYGKRFPYRELCRFLVYTQETFHIFDVYMKMKHYDSMKLESFVILMTMTNISGTFQVKIYGH